MKKHHNPLVNFLNTHDYHYTLASINNEVTTNPTLKNLHTQIVMVIMLRKKALSPLFFYPLISAFFLLDLGAFILFEKPLLLTLVCFYILQLARPISWPRIITSLTLASLECLLFYGRFGLNLVYLIPATFLGIKMGHTLYESRWQYYLLLAACILSQKLILEPFILGISSSITYTLSTLFANLIVLWVMNLLLKSKN